MPTESTDTVTVGPDPVRSVRRFNRFYTRQLGLLDRVLPGAKFSLAEGRILYELATRDGCTATQIANDLGIDAGYLSRILKVFERRRYLTRTRSPGDARERRMHLTAAGRAAFDPLDRAAREQVTALLAALPGGARSELVTAMERVERLLAPAPGPAPVTFRDLRVGDIGWITQRQALLYATEYGWDATFEALVAEILVAFVRNFDPASERAWIAEREGTPVGSVFLVRASAEVAKLRLLYVEASARGTGTGQRLVAECIAFARAKGYRTLTLWTNDILHAARRIYEGAGFQLVGEERHHSFGKDLVGQTWELALNETSTSTGSSSS
jgi:DNA-binding MarR family transcriptional regulator/GNAT superfamily N-acetyltransferase